MSGAGLKTKKGKGGGAPPLASAPEGPRRTPPYGGHPRNAPEYKNRSEKLVKLAEINPRTTSPLASDSEVSFVSMSALSSEAACIIHEETKTYQEVSKGYTPFQDGDILVAKITPCFENGKIGIANLSRGIGFGSTEFHVIRTMKESIDSRYLLHYLRLPAIRLKGERRMTGSAGQRRVPINFLEELEIPLPPLPEQRRIAEVLDRAESAKTIRKLSISKIDQVLQSTFLEIFGHPSRNEKGWPTQFFGDICETRLGKMLDQKQQTGKYLRPYLRNANVQWFEFDLTEVFEMDFDERARETHILLNGDLLICEGGEPGRCAVWRGQLSECYFQKALHRARPDKSRAIPEYLAWLLWFLTKSGGLKDFITSATIAHLTGEKLNALPIPVPPLSLQNEFLRRLVAIEKLKAAHRASLAQIDALFSSLQHRAFRGEL